MKARVNKTIILNGGRSRDKLKDDTGQKKLDLKLSPNVWIVHFRLS